MLRASGCTGCRANGSTLEVFSATNRADTALRIAGLADLAFMKDVQYRQTGRTPERSEYLIKLLAARRH